MAQDRHIVKMKHE